MFLRIELATVQASELCASPVQNLDKHLLSRREENLESKIYFRKWEWDLEKASAGYWEQSTETRDIFSASQEVAGCIRALLAAVIWNLL